MDETTFSGTAIPVLIDCSKLLAKISGQLKSKNAIVLIETEGLFPNLLYAFHKLVRKLPAGGGIDLIIHSLGGSIDAASSVAGICKERFGSFRAIVPFMAKSAATLVVLAADERLLTCSAQLGPVDPQVYHFEKKVYFPAHSIKEALRQVEAAKDPIVKATMADKLDPFLIGAYEDAISAAKQYIQEVVDKWPGVDKEGIVAAFTEKYRSHGYPMSGNVLKAINAPYTPLTGETEDLVCELHEKCLDLLEKDKEDASLILTKDEYLYRTDTVTQSGAFATAAAAPLLPMEDPIGKKIA